MILLEMRNLLSECCQFVTFLSPLVAAQHGALLSPSPSSWLWAQVWARRDCFMAPVGNFTIFFSLRNFKKPSRLYYLYTSFTASTMWLRSGKGAARFLAVERVKHVTLPWAGTWDLLQGAVGQGIKPVCLNKQLFVTCCMWETMPGPGVQRSRRGGLFLKELTF